MKRIRIIGIDIGGTKCAVSDLSPGRDPVFGLGPHGAACANLHGLHLLGPEK